MQPTVIDLQKASSAAKRRQLTCSDDDLAILQAVVRGKPDLRHGQLPPHSRLSIPVLPETVGFTHGYPLSPYSRLSTAFFVGSKAYHDCLSQWDRDQQFRSTRNQRSHPSFRKPFSLRMSASASVWRHTFIPENVRHTLIHRYRRWWQAGIPRMAGENGPRWILIDAPEYNTGAST